MCAVTVNITALAFAYLDVWWRGRAGERAPGSGAEGLSKGLPD